MERNIHIQTFQGGNNSQIVTPESRNPKVLPQQSQERANRELRPVSKTLIKFMHPRQTNKVQEEPYSYSYVLCRQVHGSTVKHGFLININEDLNHSLGLTLLSQGLANIFQIKIGSVKSIFSVLVQFIKLICELHPFVKSLNRFQVGGNSCGDLVSQ